MSICKRNPEGYIDLTAYKALSHIEKQEWRAKHYIPIVYICSPYAGDVEENVRRARGYCSFAVQQGTLPIAPHLYFIQFMDDSDTHQRNQAMRMNRILLSKCSELWVFGDRISEGMAMEIDQAYHRGMPIRYFTTRCEEMI